MDRNLLLAFALSFLVLMLWSSLQGPPPHPKPPQGESAPAEAPQPAAPPAAQPELPQLPSAAPGGPPMPQAETEPAPEVEEEVIPIERPLYRAELTTRGGGLRDWELLDYHTGGKDPQPIVLTTGESPWDVAGVTSFSELGLGDLSRVAWEIESQDATGVSFVHTQNGVTVRKRWSFEDSYTFRLRLEVENQSAGEVATNFAVGWPAHAVGGNDFREQALAALHTGSVQSQMLRGLGKGGLIGAVLGRKPQEVYDYQGENDWAGIQTTYFLSVLLPDDPAPANVRFVALSPGAAGLVQVFFDPVRIPAGLSLSREFTGYAGPKVPALLEEVGGDTIRSINLGWSWVTPLTRFFGWMLHQVYAVIPNYGVAIILLTIVVRLVTTPLTVRQMRSMERMRAVQPRLKEIQEKYKDDRQKQSEEMMRLYRQEKVNPLGGCLPMVLQLPVFIGLFYSLRSSIQLRQAPFFGWIDDLSAPEALFVIPGTDLPFRVLPLIMGATMAVQQRITPMQMDPSQARMMMTIMPIMMTVIFYQFASGLVLYWMVSNALAITHQLWIGKRMRAGGAKG